MLLFNISHRLMFTCSLSSSSHSFQHMYSIAVRQSSISVAVSCQCSGCSSHVSGMSPKKKKKGSKRDAAAVIGNIGVHETQEKRDQHRKLERDRALRLSFGVQGRCEVDIIKGRRARFRHLGGGGGVTQCWHNLTEVLQRTHHVSHCSIRSAGVLQPIP